MTMFNSTHKLTAAAFGAAAIFSVISFSSNAGASQSPLSCHGSSAKKVMDCCAETINIGRPEWMIKNGKSCHTVFFVSCKPGYNAAGAPNSRCRLRPRFPTIAAKGTDGGGHEGDPGTRDPRRPNSSARY